MPFKVWKRKCCGSQILDRFFAMPFEGYRICGLGCGACHKDVQARNESSLRPAWGLASGVSKGLGETTSRVEFRMRVWNSLQKLCSVGEMFRFEEWKPASKEDLFLLQQIM